MATSAIETFHLQWMVGWMKEKGRKGIDAKMYATYKKLMINRCDTKCDAIGGGGVVGFVEYMNSNLAWA